MAVDKKSRDLLALLSIVLAFGIVVFLNLVAEKRFARVDLTAEKVYSLTGNFQNILTRLAQNPDSPLKVTYYSSENGPSGFLQLRRDVLDKLKEVETAGHGLVQFETVNPASDKDVREMLMKEGAFRKLNDQVQDKRTQETVFSAVRMIYRNKQPAWIPWLINPDAIEYEMGGSIMKLTQQEQPIVAISVPESDEMKLPNRPPPPCGYEDVVTVLQGQNLFDLRRIDWNAPLPAKTALLVLFAPQNLSERARYEITRYLASGGHVLLLASSIKVKAEFGMSFEHTKTGLEDYLAGLGLSWDQDFTCDTFNLGLPSMQGSGADYFALPTFVAINAENVSQTSPVTRYMNNLIMPFPTALKIDQEQAAKAGIEIETLAKTSSQSWTETFDEKLKVGEIDYKSRTTFEDKKALFCELKGRFPFPWDGKAPPPFDPKNPQEEPAVVVDSQPGVLMVWSCPDSLHNRHLRSNLQQYFAPNVYLFMNIAEYASLGEDLIRIRTKNRDVRAILRLENDNTTRNLVKAFLIAFMPIVVGSFALGFWFLRRSAQVRYERRFAETTGPSSFSA
ncbi:MAG: GldG family protein [Planctomycetes bacterium]|nr:GldG family protein [Planctomycetota bacterium]